MPACHAGGRGFESRRLRHHTSNPRKIGLSEKLIGAYYNQITTDMHYLQLLNDVYYFIIKVKGRIFKMSLETDNLILANIMKSKILYNIEKQYGVKIKKMPKSIFSRVPKNIDKRINEILKKYEEYIKKGDISKVKEQIKAEHASDTHTLNLLLEKIEKLEKALLKEKYPVYTLEQCFNDFLSFKKKENVSIKTIQKYERTYKKLTEFIKPDTDLNSLDDKDFSPFYDDIVNSDYANETKAYLINNAKNMLKYAYTRHKVERKLMDRYEYAVKKKERKKYIPFTDNELKRLYNYHKKENNKLFLDTMIILLNTGMRVGELAKLKCDDVNLKERKLKIASEGGKTENATRLIYINQNIYEILKQLKNNSKDEYIIPLSPKVKNRPDTLSKKVNRKIKKIVNHPQKVVHSFRKNFAQQLYKITQAEHIIKLIMGHSQSDNLTLDTYAMGKIDFKQIKDVMKKIKFNF